jgi:tripartite-type tricarboxylate transporter receptor subunit TctC
MPTRRHLLSAAAALPLAAPALAQRQPLRILVGFPAGGTIDVVARLVAEHLGRVGLGPAVVETRAGAGGQLAAQALRQAAPDGRTLLLSPDHTLVMVPLTLRNPGFDAATDFVPVAPVATYAGGLAASARTGVADLAGFLAWARANPGAANVGIPAPGSIPQFLVFSMAQRAGVALEPVPYRGSAPLVQDLLGGQVPAGITALGDFLEHAAGGQLRVIATLGARRSTLLPAVPTLTEQGLPVVWEFWLGLFGRAGTPSAATDAVGAAVREALAREDIVARMRAIAFDPAPGEAATLAGWVAAGRAQWAPVVAQSGWQMQ